MIFLVHMPDGRQPVEIDADGVYDTLQDLIYTTDEEVQKNWPVGTTLTITRKT